MSGSPITLVTGENGHPEILWADGERVFCRGWHRDAENREYARLVVLAATDPPRSGTVDRLVHEFGLRNQLDGSWALRPLELVREPGRTILALEWSDAQSLERLVGAPMKVAQF